MSTPSGALKGQSSSIRFWLLLLFAALVLLVVNTYIGGTKNDEERSALQRVNDVQVQSQQIATYAREAAGGNLDAFSELKATRDSIEKNIKEVMSGAPGMPAYAEDVNVKDQLKKLSSTWEPIKRNADTILDHASGERIDGCDIVVRFNRAHVDGIEAKVGRRTDILVANRNYNLKKAPSPAATLRPRCVVWILSFAVPPRYGISIITVRQLNAGVISSGVRNTAM